MFPMPMKPTRMIVHRPFWATSPLSKEKRDSSTASRTRKRGANRKTMRDFARNDDTGFAQSLEAELLQHFRGVIEAVNTGGHARINHAVQQHFANFVFAETVFHRAANVSFQLSRLVQRDEQRHGDHAARSAVEERPGPNFTETIASDHFLQRPREIGGGFHNLIGKRRAEHVSANLHSGGE